MVSRNERPEMMACTHCQKVVKVPRYRWKTFRFCSRACNRHWHEANDRIDKTCTVCGKTFNVILCRKDRAKYCSRSCYYKAMTKVGSIRIQCSICSKEMLRSPSRTKYPNPCCSVRCRGILKRSEKPGTANTVRQWMVTRGLFTSCNRCGYDSHPEILVVHHKNRNRRDNEASNLEILCPNCHAIEHYAESGPSPS